MLKFRVRVRAFTCAPRSVCEAELNQLIQLFRLFSHVQLFLVALLNNVRVHHGWILLLRSSMRRYSRLLRSGGVKLALVRILLG